MLRPSPNHGTQRLPNDDDDDDDDLKREIDVLYCRSECKLFHNLGPITLTQDAF